MRLAQTHEGSRVSFGIVRENLLAWRGANSAACGQCWYEGTARGNGCRTYKALDAAGARLRHRHGIEIYVASRAPGLFQRFAASLNAHALTTGLGGGIVKLKEFGVWH
jgi:hypothetical protein